MRETTLDISTFDRSSDFYDETELLLTVKSFDLQAIRKRYIHSRTNKSGKTGSVERRKPSTGGLVSVKLAKGKILQQEILCETSEPRGLDLKAGNFAMANEQAVFIIDETGKHESIEDPWFSYIHTVQFHPDHTGKLLVSSSGFDLIREYDIQSKELTFEWLAWEHGFDKARDPESGSAIRLTRDPAKAAKFEQEGVSHVLIQNPDTDHLPTAKRAAFINSVTYHPDDPNFLLATFFHEGKIYRINKQTNQADEVLSGLKNPHGGHLKEGIVIATSTGSGEIFLKTEDQLQRISARNLGGKPEYLDDLEWIQNTLSHQELLIAIDSNRTSFLIMDPGKKLLDVIPYDPDWAVQDLVAGKLNEPQIQKIKQLI